MCTARGRHKFLKSCMLFILLHLEKKKFTSLSAARGIPFLHGLLHQMWRGGPHGVKLDSKVRCNSLQVQRSFYSRKLGFHIWLGWDRNINWPRFTEVICDGTGRSRSDWRVRTHGLIDWWPSPRTRYKTEINHSTEIEKFVCFIVSVVSFLECNSKIKSMSWY